MLTKYLSEDYDLNNSFVIGDRLTDVELAKNLGAKAIFINDNTNLGTAEISLNEAQIAETIAFETNDWEKIYDSMFKPAFVFDGRNLLDGNKLKKIGFQYQAIGS